MNILCIFGWHKWHGTYAFRSTDRPGEHQDHWKCSRCRAHKSKWIKDPAPPRSIENIPSVYNPTLPPGVAMLIPRGAIPGETLTEETIKEINEMQRRTWDKVQFLPEIPGMPTTWEVLNKHLPPATDKGALLTGYLPAFNSKPLDRFGQPIESDPKLEE